jgi:hypothetical protein
MKAKLMFASVLLVLLFAAVIAAMAQSDPQQTLSQYVSDLQKNPADTALREKIIALALSMNPPPVIPEAAREHYVTATTIVENGKSNDDFKQAEAQYQEALLPAPWWGGAYKKLAVTQKLLGEYDRAAASLNLYILTKPADARDAQDEIYKVRALGQLKEGHKDLAQNQVAQCQQEITAINDAYKKGKGGAIQHGKEAVEACSYTTPVFQASLCALLGGLYAEAKDWDDAYKYVQESAKLDPVADGYVADRYDLLGEILGERGDKEGDCQYSRKGCNAGGKEGCDALKYDSCNPSANPDWIVYRGKKIPQKVTPRLLQLVEQSRH